MELHKSYTEPFPERCRCCSHAHTIKWSGGYHYIVWYCDITVGEYDIWPELEDVEISPEGHCDLFSRRETEKL